MEPKSSRFVPEIRRGMVKLTLYCNVCEQTAFREDLYLHHIQVTYIIYLSRLLRAHLVWHQRTVVAWILS